MSAHPAICVISGGTLSYPGARIVCGREGCEGFTDGLACPRESCGVRIESNQAERDAQFRREMDAHDALFRSYREERRRRRAAARSQR